MTAQEAQQQVLRAEFDKWLRPLTPKSNERERLEWNFGCALRDRVLGAFSSISATADHRMVYVNRLEMALKNIRDLNLTAEDENGHKWANSDLIEQEIVFALAQIGAKP